MTLNLLPNTITQTTQLNIPTITIFPTTNPTLKTPNNTKTLNPKNLIYQSIQTIHNTKIQINLMYNIALNPYTNHNQNKLVHNNFIINNETLKILYHQTIIQTQTNYNIITPSNIINNHIKTIHSALNKYNLQHVQIITYTTKYTSTFYKPFHNTIKSTNNLNTNNKHTYQINPTNSNKTLQKITLNITKNTNIIIIKPKIPYLNIIQHIKNHFKIPTFTYQINNKYTILSATTKHN